MTGDRCPSCGMVLGEIAGIRYKGNLTVVRVVHRDAEGEPVEEEHVCGDNPAPTGPG